MTMVRMTMKEIKRTMTPEKRKAEIEKARQLPFVYDEDCPPQTEEELKQFRRANARKSGTA